METDGAEVRGKEMVDKRNIFHSQDSHTLHARKHVHKGHKNLKTDYVDIDSPCNFREDCVSI